MCRADREAVAMYEAALVAHPPPYPANENLSQELFFVHTRMHSHKKMQLLAQNLYKSTDNQVR